MSSLLERLRPKIKKVYVESVDTEVYFKPLSMDESLTYEDMVRQAQAEKDEEVQKRLFKEASYWMLSTVLCDEQGNKSLTVAEVGQLCSKTIGELNKYANKDNAVAIKEAHNGACVDELEKN